MMYTHSPGFFSCCPTHAKDMKGKNHSRGHNAQDTSNRIPEQAKVVL